MQPNINWDDFEPVQPENSLPPSNESENLAPSNEINWNQFDPVKPEENKPKKEKVGKFKSALYGAAEGVLAIPSLIQYGVNEISKPFEKMAYGDEAPNLSYEEENPLGAAIQDFPESEDETSRRIRTGVSGAVAGAPFGIPGIIAGLVGSQAGQTIREVYGENGKFENFGWGEGAALGADVVAGGAAGAATSLARGAARAGQQTAQRVPAIFQQGETGLQRAVIKNTIQGERTALQDVVNRFSQDQVRGFEQQASALSPDRYTQLTNSHSSGLKQQAENMFRNTQLNAISPIAATPEQGGRALQEAANAVFQQEVITAERAAYNNARQAASNLTGEAPRTIQQAKVLRDNLVRNNPTPEQQPLVGFLNNLIEDLETPARASPIVDAQGRPFRQSNMATVRPANDLVDLVQRSNQAVNYGSELRQQSHRLAPIISTLREEVGAVLSQNPSAANLYREANLLHGRNAETWGTRFMRNLRFSENPESIVGKTKLASNMRNLKEGIRDPAMQGLAERLVIGQMTEGGAATSNRNAINKLSPELSTNARNAAQELINVKDPLTNAGGRAAIRNDVLKEAAQSVNTGKRPEKILDLMQTPKGYQIVRESMNGTPESRRLFQSFERLFVEDIFSSVTDKTGAIDFSKARNIFKNQDIRTVTEQIGGPNLIQRFNQLESFANSFERNLSLYKTPEAQNLFKRVLKDSKSAGIIGAIMASLHVPVPVIAMLGIAKGTYSGLKTVSDAVQKRILANPRAVRILESISTANNIEELSKQVPRLLAEIEKIPDDD